MWSSACVLIFYSSLFPMAPVLTLKDFVGPFVLLVLFLCQKIPRKGKAVPWGHRCRVIQAVSHSTWGCLPAPLEHNEFALLLPV